MKVALIGCGAWGKNLARVFHDLGVLGMVCDPALPKHGFPVPDGSFARALYSSHSVNWAIPNDDITAVAIATPAHTHWDLAVQALEAGKDVFVEKPMAIGATAGRELVALAKACGRILMVGHIMEYHPAVQELTRQIHAGELGEIEYICTSRLQNGRVREEGLLWSLAPHDVAFVLRIMGWMPEVVEAWGDSGMAGMLLRFNGVCASMNFNWAHPFKRRELVVKGSEKALLFDGNSQCLSDPALPASGAWWIRTDRTEPLRLECQAFIDACTTRVQPLTDGTSGVRVAEVIEAAQRAMKEGEGVHIHG